MSWVDDFSSFQSSTDAAPGGQKKAQVTKSPTKKEQLEAELKLLEWHKLANDAAIKVCFECKTNHIYLLTYCIVV